MDSDSIHWTQHDGHQPNCHSIPQDNRTSVLGSCGENHARRTFHFQDTTCRVCSKMGHIARACCSRAARDSPGGDKPWQTSNRMEDWDMETLQVLNLPAQAPRQIYVTVCIEGSPCKMHLNTGSPVSIVSVKTLRQLFPMKAPFLGPAPFALRDFKKMP